MGVMVATGIMACLILMDIMAHAGITGFGGTTVLVMVGCTVLAVLVSMMLSACAAAIMVHATVCAVVAVVMVVTGLQAALVVQLVVLVSTRGIAVLWAARGTVLPRAAVICCACIAGITALSLIEGAVILIMVMTCMDSTFRGTAWLCLLIHGVVVAQFSLS